MHKHLFKFTLALLCCGPCLANASTFYIDANSGNDTNLGTSPSAAWGTLAPVNGHTFVAGDRILLHAGQSWSGVLALHGNGTAENPIILGSYEAGPKPLLKGEGADAALVLRNVSGWTVQDIAVTNHGYKDERRIGIVIETTDYAFSIHVLRVDVSDINGLLSKKAGGIAIKASGQDGQQAHFDDVLIEDCTVEHMAGEGIFLQVTTEEQRTYLNTHVRIIGNKITDVGKNAMYIRGTLDGLIDHNEVRLAGARDHGNAICIGWSKHTIVRDNEVSETGLTTGTGDNGAIDVDDGAVGAVVEYNWSHDNVGGAVNVFTEPNRDADAVGTIIRYNLSENDGIRVFGLHGMDRSTTIYNNTAYVGKGNSPDGVQSGRYGHHPEFPDGVMFIRNVFFVEGKLTFDWQGTNLKTGGNCYFGHTPKTSIAKNEIVEKVHLSGVPIHERKEASTYRIPAGSGCGPLPSFLPYEAGTDFLGTPINEKNRGTRGAIIAKAKE
jgi:hypothetical protein